jgi:putative transposase
VEKMCRVLDVSRSGYYAWRSRPKSQRELANEKLLEKIRASHESSGRVYGVRKIRADLKNRGVGCSHNRVHLLMARNNIASCRLRKFKATTNSKHNFPIAPNLLNQNFKVTRANYAWVSDITYIPTGEGWLYLAAVTDLYHKKVIGWSMDETMTKELAINALRQAINRVKPPKGVIHHSDRGSQYASHAYQDLLCEHGFQPSMSRKGNCYDNACAESFFSTLKNELIHLNRFKTRREARQAIFQYIEVFYNRQRLHASLGYRTPHEFEQMSKDVA